ncbi:DrmB family protein [Geodermatophilus sp. SYSU D00814]
MTAGGIRRAQLISPFGVGAMSVLVGGSSVLIAGLDHWFDGDHVELHDFRIEEWRLQKRLGVTHFRLPPDYRTSSGHGQQEPNLRLTVPSLRFPRWSFCPYCKRLHEHPLALQGRARCVDPKHADTKRQAPILSQVPFVIVCERGHLSDFPWREWVHSSLSPSCRGVLRLSSTGGGSLSGQVVACDKCGERRPLTNITNTAADDQGQASTFLTQRLAGGGQTYDCQGWAPWLGDHTEACGRPVRATLRGASNVYFPLVESSIYVPQGHQAPADLVEVLRKPQFSMLGVLQQSGMLNPGTVRQADQYGHLERYSDEELEGALQELFEPVDAHDLSLDDTSQTDWRRPEHALLRGELNDPDLTVTKPAAGYDPVLAASFPRVRLVETLREVRALWGFTRLNSAGLKLQEGKGRLWRQLPPVSREWLPAYEVRGEGIYLELDEAALSRWEQKSAVQRQTDLIVQRYGKAVADRGMMPREISPRLVLLHTIAHLLINQFVFECGYSSASLRERLYVATGDDPMAGILIYTAAGDSEGTMGGLVRMGRPGNLERVWDAALAAAEWCSTDPICMEAGEAGQGPDSCNLAACHACALLPETSCEEFNRFLDRGLVIGSLVNPDLGFFS